MENLRDPDAPKGKKDKNQKKKPKLKARIRVVPCNAEFLNEVCGKFVEDLQYRMHYSAESEPALAQKMLSKLAVTRRLLPPRDVRLELQIKQEDCCNMCGVPASEFISKPYPSIEDIDKVMDYDHIKPLCMGGTNDLNNLQMLCRECHAGKTQEEELSGIRPHTIESQMGQHLWEDFQRGLKPREILGAVQSH